MLELSETNSTQTKLLSEFCQKLKLRAWGLLVGIEDCQFQLDLFSINFHQDCKCDDQQACFRIRLNLHVCNAHHSMASCSCCHCFLLFSLKLCLESLRLFQPLRWVCQPPPFCNLVSQLTLTTNAYTCFIRDVLWVTTKTELTRLLQLLKYWLMTPFKKPQYILYPDNGASGGAYGWVPWAC
jgi:hypothetical protein